MPEILRATAFPGPGLRVQEFETLRRYGASVAVRAGVQGQDADALASAAISRLKPGPLSANGLMTLQRVVRHRVLLEVRRYWRGRLRVDEVRRRMAEQGGTHPVRACVPPLEALIQREAVDHVVAALDRLPTSDRMLLALQYRMGLPAEEIRRQMGYRSLDVLYVRLSQARSRLRRELGGEPA